MRSRYSVSSINNLLTQWRSMASQWIPPFFLMTLLLLAGCDSATAVIPEQGGHPLVRSYRLSVALTRVHYIGSCPGGWYRPCDSGHSVDYAVDADVSIRDVDRDGDRLQLHGSLSMCYPFASPTCSGARLRSVAPLAHAHRGPIYADFNLPGGIPWLIFNGEVSGESIAGSISWISGFGPNSSWLSGRFVMHPSDGSGTAEASRDRPGGAEARRLNTALASITARSKSVPDVQASGAGGRTGSDAVPMVGRRSPASRCSAT